MKFSIEDLKILAFAFDSDINPNGNLHPDDLNEGTSYFIDFIEEKIADGTVEYIIFNSENEE